MAAREPASWRGYTASWASRRYSGSYAISYVGAAMAAREPASWRGYTASWASRDQLCRSRHGGEGICLMARLCRFVGFSPL